MRKRGWVLSGPSKRGVSGALLVLLCLGLGIYYVACASPIGGSLSCRLTFTFVPAFEINVRSALTLSGLVKGLPYEGTVVLTNDGIYTFSLSSSWSAWVLDFDASLAFLGTVPRMDYAMLKTNTMLAGVYLEQLSLLEYEAISKRYGLGIQWIAETDITKEITVKLTAQFGLEENLSEKLKWQFGSGYDIVQRDEPANLVFTTLWTEISGVKLCGSDLSLTSKFSKERGFECVWAKWTFEGNSCPLCPVKFTLDLKLEPETKSLALRPTVEFEDGCTELYVHVDPWELKTGRGMIEALNIVGFGCTLKENSFVFSLITAFQGKLYRRRGGLNDIELRAWDYVVEPLPTEAIYYEITPYSQIVSVTTGNGKYLFAMDLYFAPGTGSLFDLTLVTIETRYKLCDDLSLRSGLSLGVSSSAGLAEFSLSF